MSVEERNGDDHPVAVTAEAAERLRRLFDADATSRLALRVRVEPGGCSGLRYAVSVESLPADQSALEPVVESHGILICFASEAELLLRGAVIDYQPSGFSVRNPNARGVCACGGTFASALATWESTTPYRPS